MMQCSWETVRTFSRNDKQLQGTPGAIAVLHTHSRRLDYHPHVHLVMPAAAIDAKRRLWRTKTRKTKAVGLPVQPQGAGQGVSGQATGGDHTGGARVAEQVPGKWVVDCKPVGNGEKALLYLGRYLYRGVIQEKDILACEHGQVTFRYQNSKTRKMETRTLAGADFLWLLLQHVVPKGFRRARNFGFLHPNSKRLIQLLHVLFKLAPERSLGWLKKRPSLRCPCCGGEMRIVRMRIRSAHSRRWPPDGLKVALAM